MARAPVSKNLKLTFRPAPKARHTTIIKPATQHGEPANSVRFRAFRWQLERQRIGGARGGKTDKSREM